MSTAVMERPSGRASAPARTRSGRMRSVAFGSPAGTTDVALIEQARQGQCDAYTELHRRYEGIVAAVVRGEIRRGAAAPDGDDVIQEVFALAWQRLGDLRDPNRFKPWLLQIARRAVLDHARREQRRPPLDHDDDLSIGLAADRAPSPEDLGSYGDLVRDLEGAIGTLSRRDATAITLAVQFGFGPAEIGASLGITANNAKVVLHRARHRLRAAMS